jgi:glutaminyl-peptide cyclotransferase
VNPCLRLSAIVCSLCLFLFLCCDVLGCERNAATIASASPTPTVDANDAVNSSIQAAQGTQAAEPAGPALHIDSERAFKYIKDIIAFGPRWDGSAGQEKMGQYIHSRLKNDQVEDDSFIADTPAGKIKMRNIVAKFPGSKDGIIVLGSHIDTNYPLRETNFIGANDGGSSTALLLAIADQLRGEKLDGYSVWLAFFDGEESIPSTRAGDLRWSDNDALYGSRHLAQKWQADGTNKKIKAFMLADMIGDKDLDIMNDTNSTPWLEQVVYHAAERLGYQSYFFAKRSAIGDDHMSFAKFGVPVADIVDLDYGYNNSFHHTTQDTIDKLSPKSLQIAGDVILETIRLIDVRKEVASSQAEAPR